MGAIMTVVYQYPSCSTCKKALQWLKAEDITVDVRHIVDETPDASTIKNAIERSGLPLRRFFNTSGKAYREGNYKEQVPHMSNPEAAEILSQNGMLIKRPLVIDKNFVLVGFNEQAWADAFKKYGS